MRKNLFFFIDSDGGSTPMFHIDPLLSEGNVLSPIASFIDCSRYIYSHGSWAIQGAFDSLSRFSGGLVLCFLGGSGLNTNTNFLRKHIGSGPNCNPTQVKHISSVRHDFGGFWWKSKQRRKSRNPIALRNVSSFALKLIFKDSEQLGCFPVLSLAAAFVSPATKISSNVLAIPLETASIEAQSNVHGPCDVENRGCGPFNDLYLQNLAWTKTVEPRTGIEFPTVLDNNNVSDESTSHFNPEVLVGTGSRTMTIVRLKSLKLYAFGFYVHPFDVCEKLGPKYGCVPEPELNKSQDFYQDILKEDINMTVRLVVSCDKIKIKTVKDVFEKSLRARLARTNPEADFSCLETFGSMFSDDIPLHVGTTINFKRTADGHLITEVGGNRIGAVQSKDLCRAFFDMYIGEIPVCERTKEEIGKNVASIIRAIC